ncbi:MAG: ATP-binding protein [Gammaproteobacteria bacterium]|jgi:hypothetical protein|nr:ATP-binding protein [Gammaproteobacteria bacterium]
MPKKTKKRQPRNTGKLRIGDDWNAIRIIALSQNNPLKAVAEFVENSIDAGASEITITRGRERGEQYLRIVDNGQGVPLNDAGLPDFHYVATHICDSVKKQLKEAGADGLQGEFGIGLLSFWTVGEHLSMTCAGEDGRTYTMHMEKGDPSYKVQQRRLLFSEVGTQLKIAPLLPGLRALSGDKLQWYLASELRERIRSTGINLRVIDRVSRKEFKVEPRKFTGRALQQLPVPRCLFGDIYEELYLSEPDSENTVSLFRNGTRVIENLTELPAFQHSPWDDGVLQGIIDADFLNLTPASRTGVLHDERFAAFVEALEPLETHLRALVEQQRRAENERASRNMLRTIHKAFKEALLTLPAEEYDWFDVQRQARDKGSNTRSELMAGTIAAGDGRDSGELQDSDEGHDQESQDSSQKQFFEYAGALHSARIAPASCVVPVGKSRNFSPICRDKKRLLVEHDLRFQWQIIDGAGLLENSDGEIATFIADAEPGLVKLHLVVSQNDIVAEAHALITVTDSLLPETRESASPRQGLPGYTFERAAGQLWRSRFSTDQNVIIINNGHRDFVHACKTKAAKLRYISRLYAKELVLKNFPGQPADQLLERLIELSLYTEENLR